jgi:acyl-CoA reductase-like NAD-dependent aldehyde dehydrogenase
MTISGISIDFKDNFIQIVNGKIAPTKITRHGINPANKQPLPPVPVATEKDVDSAVATGKTAFNTWSRVSYEDRKKSVLAYAGAIEAHTDQFVELLTLEQGKPVHSLSLRC